jgi:hypothetical protein
MSGRLCSHFSHDHFVDEAPDPGFSGFDGAHQGMVFVTKMFGGVSVLGRIAASHVAAHHAQAEVNPGISEFYALFTDVLAGGGDFDLIQMLAFG